MDCTWAGAVYAALRYMGEAYTYEQIMGMSGACYRIAFAEVWDWSATDALVAFDYASTLFSAIGYEPIWVDRIDKDDRSEERRSIVADIANGKPVIAINPRVAPEWGVITGYSENGLDNLIASLHTLVASFEGEYSNGYFQGAQAYERWIAGLRDDRLWDQANTKDDVDRRLAVNDYMLLNLIDARRCAAAYLSESVPLLADERANLLTK